MAVIEQSGIAAPHGVPDAEVCKAPDQDQVSLGAIRPILGIGSLFYAVLALSRLLQPHSTGRPLTILASCIAALLVTFWFLLRRGQLRPRWSHPVLAGLAGIVLLDMLLNLHLSADPHQSVYLLLPVIVSGWLFLSTAWLGIVLLTAVLGSTAVVWGHGFSSEWLPFGLALVAAATFSFFTHRARVLLYRRLEGRDPLHYGQMHSALALAEEACRKAEAARQNLEGSNRALQESEKKFRQLAEASFEAILVHDGRKVLEANQNVAALFGYESAEILRMEIRDFFAPGFREFMNDKIESEAERRYEAVGLKKDGRTFPIEVLGKPISGQGRHLRVKAIRDLTEREKATTALKQAEEKHRSIIENAVEGIYQTSLDGRFLSANPALARIFGFDSPSDLISHFTDVGREVYVDPARRSEFVRQLEEKGFVSEFESQVSRRDRSIIWVSENSRLVRDDAGRALYYEGFVEDITQRKEAAEKSLHAVEVAESANRTRSEFLANMSHEIRTPINGIIGMTELALDTDLTGEQREYLEIAKSSAESLLSMINQVLDFSKIEAGKVTLDPIRFSVRETVGGAMATLAARAQAKNLEMIFNVLPHVPDALVGDAYRLRQVLLNLIGNAIKFTEKGEVIVHVDTDLQSTDKVLLHFVVTDTGIGIPCEKQKAIFEAFLQADGSMTRRYGGTGLGLAISSHLVEMMGGKIWVQSEPEVGSAFHFTVCFALQDGERVQPGREQFSGLEGVRVLIVDDSGASRRILQAMLLEWNMQPSVAVDGPSALASMLRAKESGKPYGVMIIDTLRPEFDGFKLVTEMRRSGEVPDTPVIMLATPGGAIHTRSQEMGVAASLMKPIRRANLLNALLRALRLLPEDRTGEQQTKPAAPPRSTKPLDILLAEDNAVNQLVVVRMLEKLGHRLFVVGNGKDAIAAFESRPFDLIVMDAQMPEISGFEAAASIREREKATGRHIPILAMTAHALEGDREKCLSAGMDAYLAKPVRAGELRETIELLSCPAAERQAQAPSTPGAGQKVEFPTDKVLARMSGDPELLSEIIDLFQSDCPRILEQISGAIARGEAAALMRAAHTLRGSLDLFGLSAASKAAMDLELSGQKGDLAEAAAGLSKLQCEMDRCMPVLNEVKSKVGNESPDCRG